MDRISISWDQDITTNTEVESMINDAALAIGLRVDFRSVSMGTTRQKVSFGGQLDNAEPKAVALVVAQTLHDRLIAADAGRIKVSVDHMLVLKY